MSDSPQPPALQADAPAEVYDADEETFVDVTGEWRERAEEAFQNMADSMLETAHWLTVILDEKHYLVAGVETRKDFMENHLPFSKRTGERYVTIARNWFPALRGGNEEVPTLAPPADATDGDSGDQTPQPTSDGAPAGGPPSNVPQHVAGLGLTKLHQFARLPNKDLQHYVEHGELPAREGGREGFSLEEVEEMSARRAQRMVSERLRPHKKKAEQEKEKRLKAEAERDALAEELDEKQEKIEAAEALEDTWGPPAARLEDKRAKMERLEEHLREATKLVQKINVTPDDPTPDQDRAADIAAHCERLGYVAQDELHEVLLSPDRTGEL
jgi:hypothetical protein